MSGVKQDYIYTDNFLVLKRIMAIMCNNVKFCDTIFTLKETKFFALSQLLAASSSTLGSLIDTHFEHCRDKDIKLYGIKFEESFLIILKYIYGMDINFSQTQIPVMCEVLHLAEIYKLTDFAKDVNIYLSQIDFNLESAVMLLNTASKYRITELYKRLTIFAYENSDQLVKHGSFQDLQYSVLVDLLKSDCLFCAEIDILTGVLTWHAGLDDERKHLEKEVKEEDFEDQDIGIGNGIADTADNHNQLTSENLFFDAKTDLMDSIESLSDHEEESLKRESLDLDTRDTLAGNSQEENTTLSEKRETCRKTAQSFSENVLKSLLSEIRITRISLLEYLKALETEVFKKYFPFLLNRNFFSQSCVPRQQHQDQASSVSNKNVQCEVLHNTNNEASIGHPNFIDFGVANTVIEEKNYVSVASDLSQQEASTSSHVKDEEETHVKDEEETHVKDEEETTCIRSVLKTFRIRGNLELDVLYESVKEHVIGDFKWKVCLKITPTRKKAIYTVYPYLKCTTDDQNDWVCKIDCKLEWISKNTNYYFNQRLPEDNSFTTLWLNSDCSYSMIGKWEWKSNDWTDDWNDAFRPDGTYTFQLHFKSIPKKMTKGVESYL